MRFFANKPNVVPMEDFERDVPPAMKTQRPGGLIPTL
jgi:hypothetical protein